MSPKKRPNHGLQQTPKAVHVIECNLAWARIVEMRSTGRAAEAWSLSHFILLAMKWLFWLVTGGDGSSVAGHYLMTISLIAAASAAVGVGVAGGHIVDSQIMPHLG